MLIQYGGPAPHISGTRPICPRKPVPSVPETVRRHGTCGGYCNASDQENEKLPAYGRGGTGHPGRAAPSVPDGSRGSGVVVAELVLYMIEYARVKHIHILE